MKLKLLFLFLAASKTVEENPEEYDDYEDYELLQCRFPDLIVLCKLDGYLVVNKTGAIACYGQFREELEKIANKYKKDITNNQNYFYQVTDVYSQRQHAINVLKAIKDLATELVLCQKTLWDRLQKIQFTYGSNVLNNCKIKMHKYYKVYEDEIKLIKNGNYRYKIQKKIDDIHNEVERNFKKYNEKYESCVEEKNKI